MCHANSEQNIGSLLVVVDLQNDLPETRDRLLRGEAERRVNRVQIVLLELQLRALVVDHGSVREQRFHPKAHLFSALFVHHAWTNDMHRVNAKIGCAITRVVRRIELAERGPSRGGCRC